jgi:hypothetical protein
VGSMAKQLIAVAPLLHACRGGLGVWAPMATYIGARSARGRASLLLELAGVTHMFPRYVQTVERDPTE